MSSSPNYHHLSHLKIPLIDILSATNNFADENIHGDGGFGNHYKGQFMWSGELINISARRLNKKSVQEKEQEFWMEISMLSSLKHKDLVSLVGFCDENDEKIIIVRRESRGSLVHYLSYSTLLTWVRRLEICLGLAQALSYIHYDEQRDFSVIHRNIDSQTVVLNDNWEPKLSEFRLSMKVKASQRHLSFDTGKVSNTLGYTDPTYLETKSAHHKSDMYSFGIVMFELLCGRKAVIDDDQDNKYLASVAATHYKEKKLNEIIDWDLWNQMDSQSFNIFAEIAYDCLNEERLERPDIDKIVTRLEKALELQLDHHNAIMSSRMDKLGHLKIPLECILSATNNFDDKNVFGGSGYEKRYMGQLSWSGELIAITARRFNKDSDKMFWTEVLMLSSLKHQNLVSLLGFCYENTEKIIITRREIKGSLSNYLSDATLLTWVQRLKISVGLAHALSYIHYDEPRDFSVIHRDISSPAVVLNDNFEPKLSFFERSMKIEASQRHHSFHTSKVWSRNGYTDPTYERTKSVNHKTDMYSFGIVLFELLCGRTSIIANDTNKYLAPAAILHYKERKLNEIVDWDLWKQMDSQSFDMFAETAYECLNEEESQRPSMDEIVTRLEKVLELQQEHQDEVISLRIQDLAHLKIPLESILSATNNFDDKHVGGRGGYFKSYKGQLSWSDELISIDAKRFHQDRDEMFWTEVSMLSCLKHQNLVSLLGFCDENAEKIIITRLDIMGSLSNYLSDATLLTLVQRLKISVGLAHALSYIQNVEPHDFSVIHRNISSFTVLLNDNLEPKLSCFERSMKIEASQRHHSFHTSTVWSGNGYTDPTYEKTKSVNHKTDMYSFGIVLFELLCGRTSIIANDTNKYLVPAAILHYKEKKLDKIIDWDLRKQMDSQSFDMFVETAYECLNEEESHRPGMDEIVTRLEKVLELQLEHQNKIMSSRMDKLGHLKIPLECILSATNNFDDKNVFGGSGYEKRYMGQLSWSGELIAITARRFNKDSDKMFWTEVLMLSSLKHQNLVSLLGFCYENTEKIIITRREIKGSLSNYLSDATLLTWVQRLKISVGLAHALSYIHYDEPRDFSVIHRDISSPAVVLNDNFEPKLSFFERSMKIEASQRHHSFHTSKVWSRNGYTDPTYERTKSVNHKTDMYSFGIVLFELLCGRTSIIANDTNKYLAPAAILHYKERKLNEIVDWDLWKQMDSQSFDMFAETAYECLNEEESQRPSMDEIVTRLEKVLELQQEHQDEVISLRIQDLAHLKIPLESILSATNNFDDKHVGGRGGYFKSYKGQLSWSDELISIDAKRFHQDRDEMFWTEVSMLSCLKHQNLVSLLGFCDENAEKIIITRLDIMGSLSNYLSDATLLTLVQRLKISVGLAHALSYIQNVEPHDFSVIHRNISSFTVLLNDNLEPKLSCFERSMKIEASQRHHSFHTSTVWSGNGYTDPTYEKTKSVNHKTDMYSFGIVLFELLCGRTSIIANDTNKYLVPAAILHYKEKKLDKIIDWDLRKQMDSQSFDMFVETAYECLNEEESHRPGMDEIVTRLEKVLELQLEHQNKIMSSRMDKLGHLKIPLECILSATNNFDDKNVFGGSGYEKRYMGQLSWSGELIAITARRFNKDSDKMFWTEVLMLSSLKHQNLVSLLGFCYENTEKIIITRREIKGSLSNYLSDATLLTWVQRLKISVGLAHALSYIHYDEPRDFSVIHRDISSPAVVLNDNFEPKLSFFERSMKIEASQRHHSFHTSKVWSRNGYTDPTYERTKSVNHKTDMYSFGIVLFELLCGRTSIIANDTNKYLAPAAILHYKERKLNEIVDWDLWKQMDSQSFDMFAETAYECLNEEESQRPSMDEIVTRLEKVLELQQEHQDEVISLRIQDLAHLKIPLESILSATNNFDDKHVGGRGGYFKSYKGQLSWSDELISIDAKRFHQDRDEMFWTEVSMLSCLKHQNLVSLLGFCDENAEKIIITRLDIMGSLSNYLSDATLLTLVQRLKISVGLAHALSYIQNVEPHDFSVIHRNISSFTVLLNDNLEPKLSCFERSMKIEASQRHHSFHTSTVWSGNGYTDPTYEKTKSVNHKTDMYSFGIVLFELLCGRTSIIANDTNKYLVPAAILHYKEKKLDKIIDWDLRKQMDSQSFDMFVETAYECLNEEESHRPGMDEIVTRLEKVLELQLEHQNKIMSSRMDKLGHLKIPLECILSATNNFDDKNVFGGSGYEKRYMGQLSWSGELIAITARRFNKDSDKMFWTEVLMLSSLKHQNLVSLLGFCYENTEKIIITRREIKGSLSNYLSDATLLTWVQRLKISVGLAHALSYIHYDEPRDFSVIHRDISSPAVVLNDNFEPKLSFFERSMKIEASQRHHSFHTSKVWSRNGYTDPTYERTKSVNHKTDMYSFGIVLFELLCGRTSIIANDTNKYLAPAAILHYKERKLNEIVDWDLWKQMDSQSFDMFAETAYECLNEEESQRPSMDEIVTRLEKVLELQQEHQDEVISLRIQDLAHLKIPLESILSATNNFDDKHVGGRGGYFKSYKGQLSWSDELISIDAKRFHQDRDEMFWTEVSMLSCLKHQNLVSLLGFCDENAEKIIITRLDIMGSLSNYLSDATLLTLVQRLKISVGLAHALSYIQNVEPHDFSVIHRNISSFTVLLNDNLEPKLSCFERSMKIEASQRHHSFHTSTVWSGNGYTDPTYEKTKSVNHKTDMYSFGIVLFELLCGRTSIIANDTNKYLVPAAILHYKEKKLDKIIDWDLRKQMDSQSFDMFVETAYECLNEEESHRPGMDEIVTRLEKVLELQLEHQNKIMSSRMDKLGHLKIPLECILSATNNFDDKNVFGGSGYEKRYMGQLSWSGELIAITARRFNKDSDKMFWTEVLMLSSLKHQNLVSLLGFCYENTEKIIITRREIKGSLSNYLSDATLLTWVQRLKISVGLAHALSYIHYDEPRDFSVIHRDISSPAVVLNDNFEPKLSFFERSMKIEASQRHHSFHTSKVWSRNGYTDPTYERTKSVNHKTDMYSFGIVLFELLCGRTSIIANDTNKYLAPAAILHYKERKLNEIVDWDLWKQMDSQSFDMFAETAYECLNEEESQRPSMDEIVTRLEKVLELQQEHQDEVISLRIQDLAHLKIPLESILSATNNFDDKHVGGRGGYFKSYKGQLSWSDELISIDAKRFHQDRDEMFWTEVSMLSCLKHQNLVSLLGFCDENAEKIIITRLDIMGSLSNYLSDATLLTLVQRLKISVGLAHALSYIQNVEPHDFSVIHRNISSFTVLLNDNLEPKLSCFERSMKIEASQRHHSFHTSTVWSGNGYTDPTYEKTKSVNHKTDMYSFGIVLFELLCGRTSIIANDTNKYLVPAAILHYKEKKLDKIIDWDLRKQMDSQSFDMFVETAYECLNEEESHRPGMDEIVTRLEKVLELQLEHQNKIMSSRMDKLGHLKIPLECILSATNNFDDKNVFGGSGYEKRYMGQLSWSGELIAITARRFNKDSDKMFWTEVLMLSSLKHQNLVSLLGFCYENTEKIIITRREIKGSLSNYLSDATLLTWVQRLKISVGLAHALSYIHYDEPRDFSVIHRDISSPAVVLNDNFEPKLSFFERSMKIEASQRHHSFHTSKVWSRNGYTDPTYERTKSVNHKTDMYSFGIVLFELLCGRTSIIANDTNKYLAPAAILHYKERKLNEIVDWDLWKQMDSQSFDMFAETAYECLNEEESQRPSMDEIVTRLEKVLELQQEHQDEVISLRIQDLAHLKIPLESILSATNNFDDKHVGGRGGYFKSYKGQLSWSDELISIDAKRFHQDRDEMFWTEVSMLSCLKHQNLVSLLGFCDENAEKIIITRLDIMGSLSNYLSDATLLTLVQRLKISVGLAHALSYIQNVEPHDFSVIHRNISSFTVLLNDNLEPKLSCFERSMKIEASQRHHSFHTSTVWSGNGYTDPTYEKTKSVNHKTDMYSFGIVLFELLCGRTSIIANDTNKYLVPAAILHYKEKKLDKIIDWDLRKQMDSQSFDMFVETAYECLNEEESHRPGMDEIVTRLEKVLELQLEHQNKVMSSLKGDVAHLKIPLENILSATNNFDWKNMNSYGFCNEYKGQLLWAGDLIDICARRLNKRRNDKDEQQFWMEVSLLSSLKHKNVVSLVGFCDENDEKIIIIKHEMRGSLCNYISDSTRLTWVRRLEICVGLAHALSYIHYDEPREFSIIHRTINSFVVLLNDDWEPKLYFERSMKINASQRHHSFHTATLPSINGYGDPTYIETKSVNHKSDMYSFGIVLFELMCGRKSIIDYKKDNHLAPLVMTHYREKKLNNIIHRDLWKQMDLHSFNMFTEIAYECLDEERFRRPNIDDIVPRLEKALELARENKPIHSSAHHLAHLRIPLEDIESATNYFDEENVIGEGVFGKRYKGRLLWSGELIDIDAHRLINKDWNEIEQQFWTEISMLSILKHKNVVSIVGFCNEVGAETIIYKHEFRGRLDNHLSDPMLTWVKRLEISICVAHALSYIHYDEPRDISVLHQNINSYTILLNDDWEPKLSHFHHSMKINASERHHSFHTDSIWSRKGYTDPTCLETKSAHQKSDIYSFGIILFELLCGRKSVSDYQDNKYLAPVAIFHYREKTFDCIVDPDLWKQMDPQAFNVFAEIAYGCLNEERSQRPKIDDIVTRLEKALELQLACKNIENFLVAAEVEGPSTNHDKESVTFVSTGVKSHLSKTPVSSLKDLSHLRLSSKDIASATNDFPNENIITKSPFAIIYTGRLLHSGQYMDIIAKRLRYENAKNESKKFWTEILMLSSLNHKNLVSLIGFCDDGDDKMIIYKRVAKESLRKYLSDQTLTWMQRLKICVGVANALSYIHYDAGRDFSVIHCNIRSSNILIDDKWEPKLSGFQLSLKNTVARRLRLHFTRDIVKNAYLDPKYKKTGGVTHKSDVYSFGVVLLEVLCGMSAINGDEDENNDEDKDEDIDDDTDDDIDEYTDEDDDDDLREGLLSKLAKSHLDEMIMPYLRKQMDTKSLEIFSETTYWCLKEDRADRPYIDKVVKRLEKALEHQWKHENPVNRTSSIQLKGNVEHLKIGLNDINKATNNFDAAYIIGSGGFGKVYIADLEHFDGSNTSLIEGVDKCDLPRKRSTVALKRINNQEGEQGFIAEIETLSSCKHENIISLLGFCYEGNGAMILVYEHASQGSLENYLGSSDKMTTLTWVQRLNICLDIAHGLNYIHNNTDHGKQKMIHRDIKSDNILLGDSWKAKIADFGLSKFYPANQKASTIYTNMVAGTYVYLDPEYEKYGKLNKKSDIYSFGVVLLEILSGRMAYDSLYTKVNEKGIAPIARDHFEQGSIMEILDHKIKEETDEHVFSLSKGPNKESLDIFLKIAFRCVAETQAQRPKIEVVIKELKKALNSQENHKDNLKLLLEDVKLATQDFSQDNYIGHVDFGNLYRGVVTHTHGRNIIAAKRLDRKSAAKDAEFMTELEILLEYKHENVIVLVGYCDEEDEKIIVYECESRSSLDKYLSDDSLTWVMRLKICIDIAIGLEFLHGKVSSPDMVIHRDISSSNILLFDDWKAKIMGFGLSLVCPTNQNVDYVVDNVRGTIGYRDPLHSKTGFLTKESDIFSLGAVLFDMLCGKLSSERLDDEYLYLPFLAKHHYHVGKLDKLVFKGIKEQIVPESFVTFTRIAFQCLHHRRERRPTAHEVVIQLKKSLEFQEDYEKWEPKLPKDYKDIIQMSKCPKIYSTVKKEDLYNIFSKGILLQQDKVLLSFDGDRERNELVSATMFSYIGSCPHEWKSLPESRFGTVVEMLDISDLNIEIKTRAQFLSRDVVYGVYLVFKFCDSRIFSSKPVYVNLKYRKGRESMHAYFATWRDEQWMTIELHRFSNQKEDVVFEFLIESFSSYYCGDAAVYVEGIEFRAIDKVKHKENEKLKDAQQVLESEINVGQAQQLPTKFEEIFKICRNYDELFWLGEVERKKLLLLSGKAALYKISNVDISTSKPTAQSRFQEVIELLPQQVFHLKCTIKSQMLSPVTEYVCYLVFKLSEKCQGLDCPVKVQDVLHKENNEAEFVYFITPSPLNINGITRLPKQREDGWMEIQLWKFNSAHEFKDDSLSVDIKFTCREGNMSGLIICGLEFRPVLEVKVDGLPLLLDSLRTEGDKMRMSGRLQSHLVSKRV